MFEIGKIIKRLREDNNLSQSAFGKMFGYNQTTIAKWESGDRTPNIYTIREMAIQFKVSTDYLLGLED